MMSSLISHKTVLFKEGHATFCSEMPIYRYDCGVGSLGAT